MSIDFTVNFSVRDIELLHYFIYYILSFKRPCCNKSLFRAEKKQMLRGSWRFFWTSTKFLSAKFELQYYNYNILFSLILTSFSHKAKQRLIFSFMSGLCAKN